MPILAAPGWYYCFTNTIATTTATSTLYSLCSQTTATSPMTVGSLWVNQGWSQMQSLAQMQQQQLGLGALIAPPQQLAAAQARLRPAREGGKRARELLLSFLDEAQRAELSKDNAVTVLGRHARYRITYGRIANIEVYRGEAMAHRLCVHPENDDLPVEDVMLSQLLHLRADEDRLLLTANVHR